MDMLFMNTLFQDYTELNDQLKTLTQPIYIPDRETREELDELIKDMAEHKTTLKLIQSMLIHEFHSIDPTFDASTLCDEYQKWKAVITMLKHKADNSSTISKRNR